MKTDLLRRFVECFVKLLKKKTCDKCQKINHISAACKSDQIRKRREDNAKKKVTVNEMSAVVEAPAAAAAPAAAVARDEKAHSSMVFS